VAADHAVRQLASRIATNHPPAEIQALADTVSSYEIELEAAVFSMRTRLNEGHAVYAAFSRADDALTASWTAANEMLLLHPEERQPAPFEAWGVVHNEFLAAFHRAMDEARRTLSDDARLKGRRRWPGQPMADPGDRQSG
jgi:hypothetical protein